jgi:hypothetical protein
MGCLDNDILTGICFWLHIYCPPNVI